MRILIVGSDSDYAIERPYLKYIAQHTLVKEAELFAAQNIFLAHYRKSIVTKALYRLGLSPVLTHINQLLVEKIKTFRPTVVLIFKGMEIFPETITFMKGLKIKIANYNPDNPFYFSGRGSGNKNISRSVGLYDMHFTYHREVKERIEKLYKIATFLVPFGFDLSQSLYEECIREEEVRKACFLGNPDQFRAKVVLQLAHGGIAVDVFGQGWKKFVNNDLITSHDSVYGDEFWKTLRKYRVQLNIMRPHNPSSHNMRTFEIPAVGGIQLAPDTIDHSTFFEKNREINLYSDYKGCYDQLKDILLWPVEKANTMRNLARHRSVTSGYSYQDRANEMVAHLVALMNR